MADYRTFTSPRTTEPDPTTLIANLKAFDATVGVQHQTGSGSWTLKKATTWLGPQIAAAQNTIDTCPASTPQLSALAELQNMPIYSQAQVFAILDAVNVVRAALVPPLPPITPGQAMHAMQTKAAELVPKPPPPEPI